MTKKTNNQPELNAVEEVTAFAMAQTNRDIMIAVLIVSMLVNLFVLIGWVTLKVTGAYDAQVATLLFTR